jgi:signal transduction histidine kinase
VLSEVERLNDMVTTMLLVGRPKDPVKQPASLAALVESVVDMARRGPAKAVGVEIRSEPPKDDVVGAIDADQIRQVLWNLIKNAIQASGPESIVRVRVFLDPEGRACFAVQDDGEGIPDDHRDRLFDTFYSSRDHGVGLGLALAKQIIVAHGGAIEVDSTPGRGSCFTVRLPAAAEATA